MKNWWYYHKWYVISSIILLAVCVHILGNKFHWWEKVPDYQIAYVGSVSLSDDTVENIENAFSKISEDYNGDGETLVKLNQYVIDTESSAEDAISYNRANEVSLIADISDCDSIFFLLEDPSTFQREYQLLANIDGSCPDDTDYSVNQKVVPWDDSNLFLGIRCFYDEKTTKNYTECLNLWKKTLSTQ